MKSLITYILLTISLIVFSFLYYPKYKQGGTEATISWDVSGYYWYLPSLFIYKDLQGLHFSDSIRNAYGCSPDNQQITFLPDGKKVLKYSSGMALNYLPFFLLAHAVAKIFGFPADGFSTPYQLAIHFGALFMFMLGLWYLRKLLLEYFKDSTVAWILFFLVTGTNYLNYAGIDVGMSHTWLFTWYCLLLYQTNLFYKKPVYRNAMFIGFILGIMALTRPTEMIAIIIPVCWGVNILSFKSVTERSRFIKLHFSKYVAAVCMMILIGSIQLIYWKYVTRHWMVYSYGDQEFTWKHPHFYDYIMSFRCGWLLYCPMMILPYLGFLFLYKQKELFWTLAGFSFCYLWIVCAWDIWWYGGRAMIQGYAALMFPFAALIEFANKRILTRILFFAVAFFFVYLNVWWVHGVHRGGIVYASDMSEAYYRKVVGRWYIKEQERKLLDVDEDFTGVKKNIDTLFNYHFNSNEKYEVIIDEVNCLLLEKNTALEKDYIIKNKSPENNWVRASADMHCLQNNWDNIRMTRFGMRFFKGNACVKENSILLDRLFYKEPIQRIYVDAHLQAAKYDSIQLFFLNPKEAQGSFAISNLVVESFN